MTTTMKPTTKTHPHNNQLPTMKQQQIHTTTLIKTNPTKNANKATRTQGQLIQNQQQLHTATATKQHHQNNNKNTPPQQ